jgi:hypothetical protein
MYPHTASQIPNGASIATGIAQEKPIVQCLQSQSSMITEIKNELSHLRERLRPISSANPRLGSDEKPQPQACELEAVLNDHNSQLAQIRYELVEMREELRI